MVADVVDVAVQIGNTALQRRQVLGVEFFQIATTVVLERANRAHQHHRRWTQAGLAALDINKLFSAQVGTKASFGDHIVA